MFPNLEFLSTEREISEVVIAISPLVSSITKASSKLYLAASPQGHAVFSGVKELEVGLVRPFPISSFSETGDQSLVSLNESPLS